MKRHNKQKSFTLIELMTVIGIIAILAGLMLVGYNIFFDEADIGSSMRFDSSIHHSLGYALVGDWKLDDNAANSTVVDTSGNGNDGTFYSSSTEDNTANHSVDGANGRALEFDGVDDYVEVVDNKSLDIKKAITISAWAYYNGYEPEEWGLIIGKDKWRDYSIFFEWFNKTFCVDFYTNDTRHTMTVSNFPAQKGWHFIALTYDSISGYFYGYHNGKITASGYTEGGLISTNNEPLFIGGRSGGLNLYQGKVDQARLYSSALKTSQIKQQYYTGLQRLYKKGLISREEYIKRVVQK